MVRKAFKEGGGPYKSNEKQPKAIANFCKGDLKLQKMR